MAKTMSPSPITDGQIEKILDQLRANLKKRRSELSSEVVQLLLGEKSLGDKLGELIKKSAEAVSSMIIHVVTVDRSRNPQDLLAATGRQQYVNDEVVKTIPRGMGKKKRVCFFRVEGWISDADLEKEYEAHRLVPDPYAQMQVNIDDPSFADEHPNGSHWKDAYGNWYLVAFGRNSRERYVSVLRNVDDGGDGLWFGGVRDPSLKATDH